MAESRPMAEVIARLRTGDPEAAAELVRLYEPVIRSRIRVWLRMQDARLRRVFDSMDICQSVMASFFVRAAAGQYNLEQPEQLVGLLIQMARHKLSHQVGKQTARRRDIRRTGGDGAGDIPIAAADPSPSAYVAGKELLEEVRRRLSGEERQIADLRSEGHGWAAIATELGGTADGLRVKFARALDRVTAELGLDDQSEDEN